MTTTEYLDSVNKRYKSGISREHSYRGDFENLFRELISGVEITNEPANVTDCGNPDYVITKGNIPIGYIEAKDVGKDLNSKSYKEQFGRYTKALDNLIITDYVWFQFYQNGNLVHEIKIADIEDGKVIPLPDNFSTFEDLLTDFSTFIGQTIKSSKKLAEMMAAKARLLQDILERAVTSDEETKENTSLQNQYTTFKEILIHDLTPKAFADIYAQTLAYGMFAARLHDPTLDDFSRQEAAELIPKTNPFLRKLFGYIAGPDIDERIKTTVDNLADVYRATNVEELLQNFGASTAQHDPIIHFYETFLAEYDPKLRKARGVWYTPEPVVKFIVRAVDDILKSEFGLKDGLADTSKTKIKVNTQVEDKRSKTGYKQIEREVHKVQILDPATGTGTFLAEVIKYIYSKKFKAMQGAWSGYVEEHLIPRLNGFELLMASYSMAHLKLDMLLTETGYKSKTDQRFNVFLTNSLEEHHPDTGTLFSNWLSTEANEANHIKRDSPIMCIIGNPPYAVSSSNKGKWIQDLISDYKKNLNEKKINIDDDYVKFIRYGQYLINKRVEGVLAFISNNSFLDGITFREMRRNLSLSFDDIYILDLHGNAKKREVNPEGGKDENVFDIMQGVSINIFVKRSNGDSSMANVYHNDIFGLRESKYESLLQNSLDTISWDKLVYNEPYYFFVPKDFKLHDEYNSGFSLSEVMSTVNSGIQTDRDSLFVDFDKYKLSDRIIHLLSGDISDNFRNKFRVKDSGSYKITSVIIGKVFDESNIMLEQYRPFDYRYIYYDPQIISRSAHKVSQHFVNKNNVGLQVCRQQSSFDFQHVLVSSEIVDRNSISMQTREATYFFPLYIYLEQSAQKSIEEAPSKVANFNTDLISRFSDELNLDFVIDDSVLNQSFEAIHIFDYIYAVLHSPTYRNKYKEFLKIDFPRVPYPKDKKTFWQLVELGGQLRVIHLLESPLVENYITTYPIDGDNTITTKIGKKDWELYDEENSLGRIWLNEDQYFDRIPVIAWEFYIGGYQPAQKWLKDRKGRTLSYEDILHYQKIIVALTETDRLMKEIDKIDIE